MFIRKSIIAVLLVLSLPAEVCAKDMNGKFGVGFTQTVGGVTGASFRYWISRNFGLEVGAGISLLERDAGRVRTDILIEGAFFWNAVQSRHANLIIGARFDLGVSANPAAQAKRTTVIDGVNTEAQSASPEIGDVPITIALEAPLVAVEYFLSDSFSVTLTLGMVFTWAIKGDPILATQNLGQVFSEGDFGLGIGAGGFLGSASFTFYF